MSGKGIRFSTGLSVLALLLLVMAGLSGLSARAAPDDTTAQLSAVLDIPIGQTPDVDGVCSQGEYSDGNGIAQPFDDANGAGQVYLKYDGEGFLYVCIQATQGSFDRRFGSVYLDPNGDGSSYQFAQKDDYSLRVEIPTGNKSSLAGTGVINGYAPDTTIEPFWDGKASVGGEGESIEYQISYGRFFIQPCRLFGIAAYHHWVKAVGDDYGWPSNQFFDQPRTWQVARLASPACTDPSAGTIAYVYRGNTDDATSFYNLLTANGYLVDLIPLGDILATDFSSYDLTIIADDSGNLSQWGIPGDTANQVAKIIEPNKPILGLGEGGYAFFGQLSLFIGWPNGWHGPEDEVKRAPAAPLAYYASPNLIAGDPVDVYTDPVNEVGIYLGGAETIPPSVLPIGLEPPNPDHASLIMQDCRQLWGFSGNPREMTATGQNLFVNAVQYARTFQCPQPVDPGPCVSVEKTSNPVAGNTVKPGDVIEYTITYVFSDNPDCNNTTGRLIDVIPPDTLYVPGSASDGIIPTADGALVWPITSAAGNQTKTFKVRVSDTQCANQRTVNNKASLIYAGGTIESNLVSHPVECPPLQFPNDEPPYAETEIQIMPYPLITGQPSTISVRVSNTSNSAQTVDVSFQTSPNKFGIGLDFNTFASKTVTIPGNGNVIVETTFTPVSSGHYCIQIVVEGPDGQRITTQRNLDVTENLQPGVPDVLDFKVGNPTTNTGDVTLVVDNTCPGWTAVVNPSILTNMAPGEIRDATLTVTPPNPVTLGTTCHIDVQGWIGDQLIGGIRKLDVPPVHLPHDVVPSWMEQEISVIPDPAVAGQPAQICVELQNPLNVPRTVTLEYAVADFGAGIYFTTVATQQFTLPPNSIDTYCVNWTPDAGGTLHRCILVTLQQDNYADQTSQRNINLVRVNLGNFSDIDLPVLVRNPDLIPHVLEIRPTIYGINPAWQFMVVDEQGNPPPEIIEPGQTLNLRMRLMPPVALTLRQNNTRLPDFRYGDQSHAEVAVLMDGVEIGGFTLELEAPVVWVPIVLKN